MLVVLAKACVPGRVKTRLTPPLTPEEAARLAAVSLGATLALARAVPAERHVLCFDGAAPDDADGFEVIPQTDGPLDERIAAVFDRETSRTLLIGMDTPQADPAVLARALSDGSGADAWFGPAADGGFWALGMEHPRGDLVRGVRMSEPDTGRRQLRRLEVAGLTVETLPELTDVDDIGTARQVAALLPGSAFASALAAVDVRVPDAVGA